MTDTEIDETSQDEVVEAEIEQGQEQPKVTGEAFEAKKSPFFVPKEKKDVPKGRPRKDGVTSGTAAPITLLRFPRPRFRTFKNDHPVKEQHTKALWTWWDSLPTQFKDRLVVYVERDHPILLPPEIDPETGEKKNYKYIDKISGNEPIQDDLDFLYRYGAGSYHLWFNDTEGKEELRSRNLCDAFVLNMGSGDWKANPPTDPRISDVKQVDLTHPGNKSYVTYLHSIRALPEQKIGEEIEMAGVQVAEKLAEQNSAMFKEVVSMAKESGKAPAAPAPTPDVGRVIDVMADAAMRSNAIVANAATQAREMRGEETVRTGQSTTLHDTLTIIQELRKGDTGNKEVIDAYRLQIDTLSKQVEKLIDNQTKIATPASPFGSVKEGVETLKAMKETLDEIRGEGADNVTDTLTGAAADMGPKWLRNYAPLIQMGLTFGNNLLTSWLMSKQPPTPMYPMPAAQYPQSQPQQGPQPMPMQMPTALPAHNLPPQFVMLLDTILAPLASHLTLGMSGTDFADWFITHNGEATYNGVIGNSSPEQVLQAMYTYPKTAQVLQGFPQEQVAALVTEFFKPNFEDDGGEGEEGQGKGKTAEAESAS